jgi:hypothetical protein
MFDRPEVDKLDKTLAMNIEEDEKKALLLAISGWTGYTGVIRNHPQHTGDDYDTALMKLDEYFSPKENVDYEIFQFQQAVQEKGEIVDQLFATWLRKLAVNCEFNDLRT